MRVNGQAFGFKGSGFAQVAEQRQHFTFQPLQVFQRDIEKIGAATRRIKNGGGTKLSMKSADFGQRKFGFALALIGQRGGLNLLPFIPQWLYDCGKNEAFDIGARRVMGTQLVSLSRVKRAL